MKIKLIPIIIAILLLIMYVPVYADTYGLGSFINDYKHYVVAKDRETGAYQVFCTNVEDPSELIIMDNERDYGIRVTQAGKVVRYYTSDYGVTWSEEQIG